MWLHAEGYVDNPKFPASAERLPALVPFARAV